MSEYESAIALAKRLIDRKGRDIKLIQDVYVAKNPDKKWRVSKSWDNQQTVKGVSFPIQSKYVDNDTIRQTDTQFYIAASGLELTPEMKFKIIDRGRTKQVIKIDPLQPGDEPVMYTVIVRE